MRRLVAPSIFALGCLLGSSANGQTIPAFPGAEGFGGYARGGRGGDVYTVTNLNNGGPGSLAEGLAGAPTAGRTIVFAVSGYIPIPSSGLRITKSKITIAGQTAPGDGIGFRNGTFRISGDDIVVRHLRFRHGKNGSGGDCINLDSGSVNSILDHVSLQFSTDENISSYNSPPENVTMQWALNAWGLESHSCGGLWDQNHATCHHSLWAHNHTRNPKARPNGLLEWINNVTFDWDIGFIMGDSQTPADWKANVQNSYFLCPPGNIRSRALEKASLDRNGNPNFSLYLNNCRHDSNANGVLDGADKGYSIASGTYTTLAAPVPNTGAIPVTMDDPTVAFKKIVSNAGALRLDVNYSGPLRDEVDSVLIGKLMNQQAAHIHRESDLGISGSGFGTLNSAPAPIDADKDGMPDIYETALGWNVAAQDHNTALASSGGFVSGSTFLPPGTVAGYTRLEEYLHFKSVPHGFVPKNIAGGPTSLAIDLRKFASGFAQSPSFAVANITGGSVVLSGPGNSIATFTPALNYVGRARFDFTVTDAQGSAATQTCAIVVTNAGLPRDLVWKGAGNLWDSAAPNWLRISNNSTVAYSDGDRVAFDQSGIAQSNVSVSGTLAPATVEVNATGNYTLGGPGSVASTGTLTKRGTGTLTLAHSSTYAGGTALEAGAIHLSEGGGLAGGKINMLGGTVVANTHDVGTTATLSAPIEVPPGNEATIRTGNRINLNGEVTGAGTLTYDVQTTVSRANFNGAAAGFAGDIRFINGGGVRLFFNGGAFNGFDNASVDVGGSVSLQPQTNSGGNTLNIGALSGSSASANLAGGTAGAVSYVVGARNADTSFAGTITGNASLTKTGGGALTLSGSNTYGGATSVNAGALIVAGSLGNTAVTVASGAMLAGGGTIGSASGGPVTVNTGAFLSPGTAPFTGATMNVGNGLTLGAATLYFDMSGSTAGANDKIVMNGGMLTFSAAPHFQFLLLEGTLAPGTYPLITGGTNTSAPTSPQLTSNLPAGTRQTFTLQRSGSGSGQAFVQLVVGGNPATLTWTGAASANWDTNTANNWTGATPNTFLPNDAVVFNDSSTVNNVNISAPVAPRSITFNNATRAYTLGGAGSLTAGALVKNGGGALILSGTNSHWNTTINAGATISLADDTANSGALGAGPITLNGGTIAMYDNTSGFNSSTFHLRVPPGQAGTLNADSRCDIFGSLTGGGTLNFRVPWVRTTLFADWSAFTGLINVTTDGDGGDFRMGTNYDFPGFPLARVHLADRVWAYYTGILANGAGTTIEIGELSGGALAVLQGGSTGGRSFTYRIGGRTALGNEVVFAGSIQEQNGNTFTSYVKTGAGIWTLAGACAWNGGTTIEQGTLRISGSVESRGGNFRVLDGATLDLANGTLTTADLNIAVNAKLTGRGTIAGDLTNDGVITCGSGILAITGDVVNNGAMRITGGAALQAAGRFINNGVLDLLTGSGLPANLENNGVVIDSRSLASVRAAKQGNTVSVTVTAYTNHAYQLQRADSLTAPVWTDVGAAQVPSSDGQTLTFSDANATPAQRFYRVAVSP